MTPLKKFIWLVDTVMRAGETGLTLEQIADKWDHDDAMCEDGPFSKRSFHRHRNEIDDLFSIKIESYSNGSEHRYRIADGARKGYFSRWMLDSIAANRILADSKDTAQFISLESCNDTALPVLLQALKERRMVAFRYNPFWSERPIDYFNFQPHALKMFERRWYLLGHYDSSRPHLTYGLDRITDCRLQDDHYERDPDFDLDKMFDGVYGIDRGRSESKDTEIPIEEVWLKVDPYQANYLRSLRLHNSQYEVGEKDGYPIFSLRVRPTYDFKQKLLSLGSSVEVLKPESLRNVMRQEINAMMTKYPKDDE